MIMVASSEGNPEPTMIDATKTWFDSWVHDPIGSFLVWISGH
jgi:hypothetical protein